MDEGYEIERILKGKNKGGRLESWYKQHFEDGRYVVWGACYEDPQGRFGDGLYIHTSVVVMHHEEDNIIETLNSYYILGKPRGVSLVKSCDIEPLFRGGIL